MKFGPFDNHEGLENYSNLNKIFAPQLSFTFLNIFDKFADADDAL